MTRFGVHNREVRDFKCRFCGMTWLKYIENKQICSKSITQNGLHNFDFGTPIARDANKSGEEIPDATIIFVIFVYSIFELKRCMI